MRILFILDSVENPTSANVLMAQRLAGVLCAAGHTVHLLELWDGLHPQPELPGCTVHCLAFADERLMNAALENGRSGGSPIPVRLARLCCHPTALAAASGTAWLVWRTGGSLWLLPAVVGLLTAGAGWRNDR